MTDRSVPLVCVDMGTTNTRVWLVDGDRVVSRASAMVGVRDTAREGHGGRIRRVLRELIAEVRREGREAGAAEPARVAAAGMITSALGLAEVPHLPAPAGAAALGARAHRARFPEVTELEVLLVPGVRTGPERAAPGGVGETDVMRGEETLCVGLLQRAWLPPGGTLLNLGSHWKSVRTDAGGRIAGSTTSLAGEMIHAAQTQTILASSLPAGRPGRLDPEWVRAGACERRAHGLARALFCVRLLEQRAEGTAEQRFAFLAGAFVADGMDALLGSTEQNPAAPVVIAGGGPLAEAWADALAGRSVMATVLSAEQVEAGLLRGLRAVAG